MDKTKLQKLQAIKEMLLSSKKLIKYEESDDEDNLTTIIRQLKINKIFQENCDFKYKKAKEIVITSQEVDVEREYLLSHYREEDKKLKIEYHQLMIKLIKAN
jgi:hypothetical protein